MHVKLISVLACPDCRGELSLESCDVTGDIVKEGTLICCACQRTFPVRSQIPYFLQDHQQMDIQIRNNFARRFSQETPAVVKQEISRHHYIKLMEAESNCFARAFRTDSWLLDAGIGWGWHWQKTESPNVIGVDFSFSSLLISKEMLKDRLDKNIHLICADVASLPFKDRIIDAIWSVQTLQHIPPAQLKKVLHSFERVLKSDAGIQIYWLNFSRLFKILFNLFGRTYNKEADINTHFLKRITGNEIKALFSGLKRERALCIRYNESIFHPDLKLAHNSSTLLFLERILSKTPFINSLMARQIVLYSKNGEITARPGCSTEIKEMKHPSRVKIFRDFKHPVVSREWNRVAAASGCRLVFQRLEWFKNWCDNFVPERELFIFSTWENETPLAFVPLMVKKLAGLKYGRVPGDEVYDNFDFIVKPGEEEELVDKLLGYLRRENISLLDLRNIPVDSEIYKNFRKKIESGQLKGEVRPSELIPILKLTGNFTEVFGSLKKSLREDLKRQHKRLKERGELRFDLCNSERDIANTLNMLFRFHKRRWEAQGGYSVFGLKPYRDFYLALSGDMFSQGLLNVFHLSCGEEVVACCFCFIYNNRLIYYTPAYNPDFASFSPGKLLIGELTRFCCQNDIREIDFGKGEEAYKKWWADQARPTYNISLYLDKGGWSYFRAKGYKLIDDCYSYAIIPALRKNRFIYSLWHKINRARADVHFKI